jgi:hypothetical protein
VSGEVVTISVDDLRALVRSEVRAAIAEVVPAKAMVPKRRQRSKTTVENQPSQDVVDRVRRNLRRSGIEA